MTTEMIVTYEIRCDMCGMKNDPNSGGVEKPVENYNVVRDEEERPAGAVYIPKVICPIDLCYVCRNKVLNIFELFKKYTDMHFILLYRSDEPKGDIKNDRAS